MITKEEYKVLVEMFKREDPSMAVEIVDTLFELDETFPIEKFQKDCHEGHTEEEIREMLDKRYPI